MRLWRRRRRVPFVPRFPRRLLTLLIGVAILIGIALRGEWQAPQTPPPPPARAWTEPPATLAPTPTTLAACRAVDGDTLHCEGIRVRLRGVDTPEAGEPRYREATRALQSMVDACRAGLTLIPRHRSHDRIVGDVLCERRNIGQAMDAAGWSKPVGARR